MDDTTLGWILLLVGIVLLFVVAMGKQWHLPAVGKWFFGVLGAVFAIVGIVLGFGLIALVSPPAQIAEQPTYDVTANITTTYSVQTWVTYNADTKTFTMAAIYGLTSLAAMNGTGSMDVNFTIARSDVLSADYITSCSLGTVSSVSITGSTSQYILAQNADLTFAFKWTKLGGVYSYENCNVKVPSGSDNFAILNVTVNNKALAGMSVYGSSTVRFTVAGQSFSIVVIEVNRSVQ